MAWQPGHIPAEWKCCMNEEKNNRLLHTPEGVRDIYGAEYARRRTVTDRIRENMLLYGYEELKTPSFEFFDVFSREIGTTPSKELYKFFDKEGNTLALRPDFTPSAARCAAKYYMDDKDPIRFCYEGSAFANTSNLQGKLKESTQMGVELINDDSPEADAETIALLVACLRDAGLEQFKISIGNADYFRGICEEAKLDRETEAALRENISGKNIFAAEKLLQDADVPEADRSRLLAVTDFIGPGSTLEEAEEKAVGDRALKAVRRLQNVYEILKEYGATGYVSFDLSMLSKYDYYTGIIFRGYTYGVGDVVASGGRYDNLIRHFGKNAPAVGFMIPVDTLMEALRRQNISIPVPEEPLTVMYRPENFASQLHRAEELRRDGRPVRLIPERNGQG